MWFTCFLSLPQILPPLCRFMPCLTFAQLVTCHSCSSGGMPFSLSVLIFWWTILSHVVHVFSLPRIMPFSLQVHALSLPHIMSCVCRGSCLSCLWSCLVLAADHVLVFAAGLVREFDPCAAYPHLGTCCCHATHANLLSLARGSCLVLHCGFFVWCKQKWITTALGLHCGFCAGCKHQKYFPLYKLSIACLWEVYQR